MTLWGILHPRRVREAKRLAVRGSLWRKNGWDHKESYWRVELVDGGELLMSVWLPHCDDARNAAYNFLASLATGGPPFLTYAELARHYYHCPASDSVEQAIREASHA